MWSDEHAIKAGELRGQSVALITLAELRTYVINLPRRPDRHAWMTRMLPADLPVTFTSDWTGPFDGHELSQAQLESAGDLKLLIEHQETLCGRQILLVHGSESEVNTAPKLDAKIDSGSGNRSARYSTVACRSSISPAMVAPR